ncbi:MAG: enoyl-CoA hydratase/isomerase family protein, partial [Candidatus Margulisbacteria bacterium]|nr:enoyl-CoA hydratase/isomerase family protein [Candidatus Margulisiibacteriota bacterium]
AVIDGACLGGGLEFALACTHRVASDNPKTQLGLPEVSLGIIPGFGGTQRLPKLIGLQNALPIILTGKPVNGKKALKISLIDGLISHAFSDQDSLKFVHSLLKTPSKCLKPQKKSVGQFFKEDTFLGRSLVFAAAKNMILSKTKGHFPAPLEALKVVKRTYTKPLEKGLKIEARYFGKRVPTSLSKNLIGLFYIQESLKKYTGVSKDISPKTITNAGVVGAGFMGGGIAWLFANAHIPTRLKDINWEALSHGLETIHSYLKKDLKRKKIMPYELKNKLSSVSTTVDYTGFQHTDIVVEAIVENMDLKKSVFKELESHVSKDTVLASNTSSLSITEMASGLTHPERFIGMHFFSPVNRMPLVEVIPGKKTNEETIASTVAWAKSLKKTPIVVQNCPGFLVNRILNPYINEAVLLVQEGVSMVKIDSIAVQFGMPLGPLTLADEVGLDIGFEVAKILESAYGERMKTAAIFENITEIVNCLGKKTKKGFYIHTTKDPSPNPEILQLAASKIGSQGKQKPAPSEDFILDRLILTLLNEASRCLEEHVVESPAYLDMAMIMGTGFPVFRGGICRYADDRGITNIVDKLNEMTQLYGKRFTPSQKLASMKTDHSKFY